MEMPSDDKNKNRIENHAPEPPFCTCRCVSSRQHFSGRLIEWWQNKRECYLQCVCVCGRSSMVQHQGSTVYAARNSFHSIYFTTIQTHIAHTHKHTRTVVSDESRVRKQHSHKIRLKHHRNLVIDFVTGWRIPSHFVFVLWFARMGDDWI